MTSFDALPPGVYTRAQAREHGLTDRQIDRARSTGRIRGVRHGILVASKGAGNSRLPIEVTSALLAVRGRQLVVSHETAARLHDLPRPRAGWRTAMFTARTGTPRKSRDAQIRVAPLGDDDIQELDGILVTSPARTIADCLRTLPTRDSLAIVDAAWHRGLVTDRTLLAAVEAQQGWPGIAAGRKVLSLADPRRESPLESWSALAFFRARIAPPQWQALVRSDGGEAVGRVDCWWPEGVAGEADGRTKYALAAAERGGGHDAVFQVLHSEREREQRLRTLGVEVVRWGAADVLNDTRLRTLTRRITAARSAALTHPRFTGAVEIMHPPYAR